MVLLGATSATGAICELKNKKPEPERRSGFFNDVSRRGNQYIAKPGNATSNPTAII